jgi:hypothetical protein
MKKNVIAVAIGALAIVGLALEWCATQTYAGECTGKFTGCRITFAWPSCCLNAGGNQSLRDLTEDEDENETYISIGGACGHISHWKAYVLPCSTATLDDCGGDESSPFCS